MHPNSALRLKRLSTLDLSFMTNASAIAKRPKKNITPLLPNGASILWHDYETWGVNPKVDFPCQFAAIRTDLDLNIIENSSVDIVCKIPHDYLPHPVACLVTGINPFYVREKGLTEPQFADEIYQQMMHPNTCVAGYNSMKFDEEVSRNLFYRNFYPIYDREFKNSNSRWDVIDLIRACFALRPEHIIWPKYDNGQPCFKLEALAEANGIEHSQAHNALSDVHATIGITKLIKDHHPKLFEYYFTLRSKHEVAKLLHQFQANVFVYVSAFIKAEDACTSIIMPVCVHPDNPNSVICIDLTRDISIFLSANSSTLQTNSLSPAQNVNSHGPRELSHHDHVALIKEAVFTKQSEQNSPHLSPRIFTIALNKCPFIAPIKVVNKEVSNRLGIDLDSCIERFKILASQSDLPAIIASVFHKEHNASISDNIDENIYASDFPSSADIQLMEDFRRSSPQELVNFEGKFQSDSLNERIFRYRARNYPYLLSDREAVAWQKHLRHNFMSENKTACLSLSEFSTEIQRLTLSCQNNPDKLALLQQLESYATEITGIK